MLLFPAPNRNIVSYEQNVWYLIYILKNYQDIFDDHKYSKTAESTSEYHFFSNELINKKFFINDHGLFLF